MPPSPTDGWHCAGSGGRCVHPRPALGVGAAAVRAAVQSLRRGQVRHALPGAMAKQLEAKLLMLNSSHIEKSEDPFFVSSLRMSCILTS